MYLDDLARQIRAHIPVNRLPKGNADELFRLYAVLLRAKGSKVTCSDIHDAWSAWMVGQNHDHDSLIPYESLDPHIRDEDRVFVRAVQSVAERMGQTDITRPHFVEILFPHGPPSNDEETRQAFDLYKIIVDSSENLVSRRQGVNTFFLTINSALFTAAGIILQISSGNRLAYLGVSIVALAGAILCAAWRSLITSFGQLNRGKFLVINSIEQYLKAAIYAAEWEALGRGENPKIYRSFTSREIWVPNALLFLYALAAIAALAVLVQPDTDWWFSLMLKIVS